MTFVICSTLLLEHDLFRKPVSTFRDHALGSLPGTERIFSQFVRSGQAKRPWQCLYFLPEPHGHASLRPTLPQLAGFFGSRTVARSVPKPLGADGTSDTSASAISSSPVTGSTLWASM